MTTAYVDTRRGSASGNGTRISPWANLSQADTALGQAGHGITKLLLATYPDKPLYADKSLMLDGRYIPAGFKVLSAFSDDYADVRFNGGVTPGVDKDLGTATWTATTDMTNTYQTTLAVYFTNICVLELATPNNPRSQMWYQLIPGATWNAVKATVDSTAGSYWLDNATGILYVHMLAGGSPAGKPLVRTFNWRNVGNESDGFIVGNPTLTTGGGVQGIEIARISAIGCGTCATSTGLMATTGSGANILTFLVVGGINYFHDLYLQGGGEHVLIGVDGCGNDLSPAGTQIILADVQAEQMHPFNTTGTIAIVSGAVGTTSLSISRFRTDRGVGVYRSIAGASTWDTAGSDILHHPTSDLGHFSSVTMVDSAVDGVGFTDSSVGSYTAKRCLIRGGVYISGNTTTPAVLFESCTFPHTTPYYTLPTIGTHTTLRSCLLPLDGILTNMGLSLSGVYQIIGCTIDATKIPGRGNIFSSLGAGTVGLAAITFRDNAIIAGSESPGATIFKGLRQGELVEFSNNQILWQTTSYPVVAYPYTATDSSGTTALYSENATLLDGSLTAAGVNVGAGNRHVSLSTLAATFVSALTGDYRAAVSSPLLGATTRTNETDWTGLTFPVRNDVGALQTGTPATPASYSTEQVALTVGNGLHPWLGF